MSEIRTNLPKVARVNPEVFERLEADMLEITGRKGVIEEIERDTDKHIQQRLDSFGLISESKAEEVIEALTNKAEEGENELYKYIGITREDLLTPQSTKNVFEKIKKAAYVITSESNGFFLKKDKASEILKAFPPEGTIKYLGHKDVEEMLNKEDVMDVMSALRFTESEDWMHKMFDAAYIKFVPEDFEQREIELRILGAEWEEIAKKFVAKKHHNVSHLKEFGVIFLNPINQNAEGALLRDFALFFHYFHEVSFYSNLFQRNFESPEFNSRFLSLLRGDVAEKNSVEKGEWLIVQKYLWKINPDDPRIHLPRVNPESLHWRKGEDDAVGFGEKLKDIGLEFWNDLDWVAGYFQNEKGEEQLVSFDMEDTAMSLVSKRKGDSVRFNYHQQEALWNEIFRRYVGKEERYKLILENFHLGSIKLN